jgi:hypothetical protein
LSVELGFGKGRVFPRAADRVWREPPAQYRFQMRREYIVPERAAAYRSLSNAFPIRFGIDGVSQY